MATITVHCPRCQSALVYRHGQNPKGRDRFRCRECHRVFLLTYTYEARKPGVKEHITEMAFNGAGVRDTAIGLMGAKLQNTTSALIKGTAWKRKLFHDFKLR